MTPTDFTPYITGATHTTVQLTTVRGSITLTRDQLEDLRQDIDNTLDATQSPEPLVIRCALADDDIATLFRDQDGDLCLEATNSDCIYLDDNAVLAVIEWLTAYREEYNG